MHKIGLSALAVIFFQALAMGPAAQAADALCESGPGQQKLVDDVLKNMGGISALEGDWHVQFPMNSGFMGICRLAPDKKIVDGKLVLNKLIGFRLEKAQFRCLDQDVDLPMDLCVSNASSDFLELRIHRKENILTLKVKLQPRTTGPQMAEVEMENLEQMSHGSCIKHEISLAERTALAPSHAVAKTSDHRRHRPADGGA